MRRKHSQRHLAYPHALTVLIAHLERATATKRIRQLTRGLFTHAEIVTFAQRLRIAQLLAAGWSFRMIVEETGASTRTVAKVHRWLKADNPSYRPVMSLRLQRRHRRPAQRSSYADTPRLSIPRPKGLTRIFFLREG